MNKMKSTRATALVHNAKSVWKELMVASTANNLSTPNTKAYMHICDSQWNTIQINTQYKNKDEEKNCESQKQLLWYNAVKSLWQELMVVWSANIMVNLVLKCLCSQWNSHKWNERKQLLLYNVWQELMVVSSANIGVNLSTALVQCC